MSVFRICLSYVYFTTHRYVNIQRNLRKIIMSEKVIESRSEKLSIKSLFHSRYGNFFLFVLVLFFCFVAVELSLRTYSLFDQEYIPAADASELAKKQRYQKLLSYDTVSDAPASTQLSFVFDPQLGLRPRSNATVNQYKFERYNATHDIEYVIYEGYFNEQGMRLSHEVSVEKNHSQLRVAHLGDSFTFGDESNQRLTFPNQMQSMNSNIEVLNFGMSSVGVSYMYLIYKEEVLDYSPDVVVMNLFIQDLARDMEHPFKPNLQLNQSCTFKILTGYQIGLISIFLIRCQIFF